MIFWKSGGKGWLTQLMNESVTGVFIEQPRLYRFCQQFLSWGTFTCASLITCSINLGHSLFPCTQCTVSAPYWGGNTAYFHGGRIILTLNTVCVNCVFSTELNCCIKQQSSSSVQSYYTLHQLPNITVSERALLEVSTKTSQLRTRIGWMGRGWGQGLDFFTWEAWESEEREEEKEGYSYTLQSPGLNIWGTSVQHGLRADETSHKNRITKPPGHQSWIRASGNSCRKGNMGCARTWK